MAVEIDLDICYELVLKTTLEAGKLVRDRIWAKEKVIELKSGDIDLVTETDKQVEQMLIDNITQKFPKHKFIGEESTATGKQSGLTDEPTWIIDPVDGTMNFVHGFPHCCISIALYVQQQPKIGIIYNPTLDQLFTARENAGAFLNGNPIKVSGQKTLSKALIMIEAGTSRDEERMGIYMQNVQNLTKLIHGTRSLGSCALNMAMVALGAADICFEMGIHVWDIAAGILIVREAGGLALDPTGKPVDIMSRRILVASSQEIADELVSNLVQFYPTPTD